MKLFHRYFLAEYINIVVRSLISFLIFGSIAYFVLLRVFNLNFILIFVIIILLSLFASPLFSKINVGYAVQSKYDKFLERFA